MISPISQAGVPTPPFYITCFLSCRNPSSIYRTNSSLSVSPWLMAWILSSSRRLREILTGICTMSSTNFFTLDSFSKHFTSTFYASTYIFLLLYKFIVTLITK